MTNRDEEMEELKRRSAEQWDDMKVSAGLFAGLVGISLFTSTIVWWLIAWGYFCGGRKSAYQRRKEHYRNLRLKAKPCPKEERIAQLIKIDPELKKVLARS